MEKHYSDVILDLLVQYFGWQTIPGDDKRVRKTFCDSTRNGELNPDGELHVFAVFDEGKRRYLALELGFVNLFEFDCRDAIPLELARDFDTRVCLKLLPAVPKIGASARLSNNAVLVYEVDGQIVHEFMPAILASQKMERIIANGSVACQIETNANDVAGSYTVSPELQSQVDNAKVKVRRHLFIVQTLNKHGIPIAPAIRNPIYTAIDEILNHSSMVPDSVIHDRVSTT